MTKKRVSSGAVLAFVLFAATIAPTSAQPDARRAAPVVSPEVLPDGKVAFRLRAPQAAAVRMESPDLAGLTMPTELAKNEEGVWELVYGPVTPPRAMRYHFNVDGVSVNDPVNRATSESNSGDFSLVFVPGLEFMELRDVPHGAVAEVTYYSSVLKRFRRMHVYTPRGYETSEEQYPVFYLLHGATDSDDSWSTVGRANFILDNLIEAGKAAPMVVVMPDGHVSRMTPRSGFQMEQFVEEFSSDIVPTVENTYRVRTDRAHRAIAGLSMGGAQTLDIVTQNLADYAYVGVFSSGVFSLNRSGAAPGDGWEEQRLSTLQNADLKDGLKLLWLATGRDDFLIETSRATVRLFQKHDFDVTWKETDGGHTWINWRNYLHEFAPLLFQEAPAASRRRSTEDAAEITRG